MEWLTGWHARLMTQGWVGSRSRERSGKKGGERGLGGVITCRGLQP